MVEGIWKVVATIVAVAGFLGSIVIAIEIGEGLDSGFLGFIIFIVSIIFMLIPAFLIYSVGELFTKLRISNENTYEIYHLLNKRLSPENINNGGTNNSVNKSMLSELAKEKRENTGGAYDSVWMCAACYTKNDSENAFCTNCGEHR